MVSRRATFIVAVGLLVACTPTPTPDFPQIVAAVTSPEITAEGSRIFAGTHLVADLVSPFSGAWRIIADFKADPSNPNQLTVDLSSSEGKAEYRYVTDHMLGMARMRVPRTVTILKDEKNWYLQLIGTAPGSNRWLFIGTESGKISGGDQVHYDGSKRIRNKFFPVTIAAP